MHFSHSQKKMCILVLSAPLHWGQAPAERVGRGGATSAESAMLRTRRQPGTSVVSMATAPRTPRSRNKRGGGRRPSPAETKSRSVLTLIWDANEGRCALSSPCIYSIHAHGAMEMVERPASAVRNLPRSPTNFRLP